MDRIMQKSFKEELRVVTHFSFGDGSARSLYYEVGPERMKKLQQDQKQIEDPPRWIGPYNLPALKQRGV